MSQKKQSIKEQQKDKRKQQAASSSASSGASKLKLSLGLIIASVAFLLYSNTINHKYVLDDYSLILENTVTRQGVSAIPEIFKTGYRSGYFSTDYQLYRPLSKAMFALEWQAFPNVPSLSHRINVLLFALSCYVLFMVLSLLLTPNLLIPFIASLLFAAHPIHTEVVANIKSRDEILSFLFVLLSAWIVIKYIKSNSIFHLLSAALLFFISLFSKESGITFLAVVPVMIYFFTDAKLSKNMTATLALVAVSAIFLLIRRKVLGEVETGTPMIDNYLEGIKDFTSQKATAIFLMGIYFLRLVVPHPLVSDGSYSQFPMVTMGDWRFLLSFAVYAAIIVYAIMKFKKKDIFSFSIIYFLITASITSNVLFLIGTNYGERLMYVPSLGFCIALAALFVWRLDNKESGLNKQSNLKPPTSGSKQALNLKQFFSSHSKVIGLTVVIVLLYSAKTISRNSDWYDNFSLYSKDVQTAPNSARNHFYLGNHLTQDEVLNNIKDSVQRDNNIKQGIAELNKAIEIYPSYADAYHKLAKIYMEAKDYKRAEPLYEKALALSPNSPTYLNNYGTLLFNLGRFEEAKKEFEQAVKYNPYYAHAFNNLASIYGTYGQNYSSLAQQSEAKRDMQGAEKNRKLAAESFNSAIFFFQQAIKVDPGFAQPYYLVGITYRSIGDEQNAKYYLDMYERLKK